MGRQMRLFMLLGVIVISGVSGTTWAAEPKNYLQTNISAAKISVRDAVYTVDVQILASDFEEMFRKHLSGLGRVDFRLQASLKLRSENL